jgi:hypothetical protein
MNVDPGLPLMWSVSPADCLLVGRKEENARQAEKAEQSAW